MNSNRVEELLSRRLAEEAASEQLCELDRILRSERFRNCPKKYKMLRFVVEETVLRHDLKEIVIGTEVFKSGYDPARDCHVRVAAGEIRDMLREYYLNEGKSDPLRIDLPVGCYTPVFAKPEFPVPERAEDVAALKDRLRIAEDENSTLRKALADALMRRSGAAAD